MPSLQDVAQQLVELGNLWVFTSFLGIFFWSGRRLLLLHLFVFWLLYAFAANHYMPPGIAPGTRSVIILGTVFTLLTVFSLSTLMGESFAGAFFGSFLGLTFASALQKVWSTLIVDFYLSLVRFVSSALSSLFRGKGGS